MEPIPPLPPPAVPLAPSYVLYWLGAYCCFVMAFVVPPPAMRAMGFTVQAIFADRLGSPIRQCVGYHVKSVACKAR